MQAYYIIKINNCYLGQNRNGFPRSVSDIENAVRFKNLLDIEDEINYLIGIKLVSAKIIIKVFKIENIKEILI